MVGLGGFIGAISRYSLGKMIHKFAAGGFPYGTLLVNVIGCVIIGIVSRLLEKNGDSESFLRLFLMVGLIGGFTTFSAFGHETLVLWRNGQTIASMLNITANIVLGLAAVSAGRYLAQPITG